MNALATEDAVQGSERDNINHLSQQIGEVVSDIKAMRGNVDDLKAGMIRLTEAMTSIVRLEVKHDNAAATVQGLMAEVDKLKERVGEVERKTPAYDEARGWAVRLLMAAAIAGLGFWAGFKP